MIEQPKAPLEFSDSAQAEAANRQIKSFTVPNVLIFAIMLVCAIVIAAFMIVGTPAHGMFNSSVVEDNVASSYTSSSQSTNQDRAENLRLACEAINGTTLEPEQVFSFNAVVGNTEEEGGYRTAPAIGNNDTLALEKGGGVCQVASTLYVAALQMGLEVMERHPHTVATDYVPIGLDATISYGEADLCIKNTSGAPMRIEAYSQGQTVTVKLYGTALDDGKTIEVDSKIVDKYSVTENNGKTNDYYTSKSYSVVYENGTVSSQTEISTDTYVVSQGTEVSSTSGGVSPSK